MEPAETMTREKFECVDSLEGFNNPRFDLLPKLIRVSPFFLLFFSLVSDFSNGKQVFKKRKKEKEKKRKEENRKRKKEKEV